MIKRGLMGLFYTNGKGCVWHGRPHAAAECDVQIAVLKAALLSVKE